MEDKKEQIKWMNMNKREAAILIAEMHQMCKAGLSNNISLHHRSKKAANFYFGAVGSGLHVFAKSQGKAELGLSDEDVKKLFSHRNFFGGMHCESYVEIPLNSSEQH